VNASRLLRLTTAALLAAACGRSDGQRGATATAADLTIAVVPKGTTHEFWKAIHAGAVQAARELAGRGVRVNVVWKGPLR